MRVLSQGKLARRIAQALLAAFLWSVTLMGAGMVPASAQIPTRAATAQSIAVAPIENLTTYQPETLGPTARALVSDELQTRLLLDVLPSKDVDETMRELGLKVPLSESELERLATELEVSMVVTGAVRKADVVVADSQRYAEVTLSLSLFDRASAAAINSATVTERSPSSADGAADDLIAKALEQAVFKAVHTMKTTPTVTASVLWSRGEEIFTNAGTRAGLREGMRMAAIRGGQRIAIVLITKAETTGSYGKVVEGSQLQTGDYLRAVVDQKAEEKPTFVKQAKKEGSKFEKAAIAAGILLGLGGFINGAKQVAEANTSAVDLQAANVSNGADLKWSGLESQQAAAGVIDPISGDYIVGFVEEYPFGGATVIQWRQPSGLQAKRIAAFVVWRRGGGGELWPGMDHIVGVAVPREDSNYVVDQFSPDPERFGAGVEAWTFDVDPATGAVTNGHVGDGWSPEIDVNSDGEITYNPEYQAWVDSFNAGAMNAVAISQYHVAIAWQVIRPEVGVPYEYAVEPIVIENRAGGYEPNPSWEFQRADWKFSTGQRVVSVNPPTGPTSDGGKQVIMSNASALTVKVYNERGIDEMIVQVTRDQGVGQPISFEHNVSRTVAPLDPNAGLLSLDDRFSPPSASAVLNIPVSELYGLPGVGNTFWLRVGGRNRSDRSRPTVWPTTSGLAPGDPLFYDQGWVWWASKPYQLNLAGMASLAAQKQRRDRQTLMNSRTDRGVRIHDPRQDRPMHTQ